MSSPLQMLASLEGTRFCLVYMEVLDAATQKLKLTPVHGVARVLPDRLVVEESSGVQTAVPDSALSAILPSDGNALLKDAAHYVIVKMAASA